MTHAIVNYAQEMRFYLRGGLALLLLLVFGVGGWAMTAEIAGAVIASGVLVVESDVKKIQHPSGGVVGELLVHEGSAVRAGDILVRLDETVARSTHAIAEKMLNENLARQARLRAERDGQASIPFPLRLTSRILDREIEQLISSEEQLWQLRTEARDGQKAQLRQRSLQLDEEIKGQTLQVAAKAKESGFIGEELAGLRTLYDKKLVPISRVTAMERDSARIEGERGVLLSAIAQSKGRISEIELQILQLDQTMRSDVGRELREVDGKIAELIERETAAADQLKRIDIRAPQDGVVHMLTVHTIGGVIAPGDAIMTIVPRNDMLSANVKVLPNNIDQVQIGLKATLKMSSLNQHTTPDINGVVERVAADLETDQRTGASHYTVRIKFPQADIESKTGVKLVPGMPVEAYIRTGDRTVMSYLTKPLADQMNRALREK